jgi:uncharacterized protein YjbI with pentapeptide repeats
VVAPAILVIFHFYVFLQLYGLATKAREYNDLLKEQVQADSDRQRMRQRLDTFLVLQFLAGPKEQRHQFQGFSLRLIAWITLVGAPILILLQAQLTFLAYHHVVITWVQRLLLFADLIVIWGFWNRIRSQDDAILGQMLSHLWRVAGIALSIAALIFSVLVATFAGEMADEYRRRVQAEVPYWPPLHELLVAGAADQVTGQPQSLFSNRLVLSDQTFVDSEKVDKVEVSRSFRGRDLRGAVLNRADLRKVDFTGSILDEADLDNAKLEKAQFGCASRARLLKRFSAEESCTSLKGASLDGARLQGASLERADLTGASLYGAELQGASLFFAKLRGASLDGARLEGASLANAELQGASFSEANLQGVSLHGAELQGASLSEANLQGALLSVAQLQGASLQNAQLQGASVEDADLTGASLERSNVWRVEATSHRLDLTSIQKINCTAISWAHRSDLTEQTFQGWRDKILSTIPEGDEKDKVGQRLLVLDPDEEPELNNGFWNET